MDDCIFKTNDIDEAHEFLDSVRTEATQLYKERTFRDEYDVIDLYDTKRNVVIGIKEPMGSRYA